MSDAIPSRLPRRVAVTVVCMALAIVFLGANVTTTASGDAIPTWPRGLSFADAATAIEMSHRVAAALGILGCVGLLWAATVVRWQDFRAGRVLWILAWTALSLIVVQAILGGFRVLFPKSALKVAHATLGQVFFCVAVAAAAATSRHVLGAARRKLEDGGLMMLRASLFSLAALLAQVLLGALGRHDVIPREVHAVFALVAFLLVARLVLVASSDLPREVEILRGPAAAFGFLAALQLVLGIAAYMVTADPKTADPLQRGLWHVIVLNLHVVIGSGMLGLNVVMLVRTLALWGLPTPERVEEARAAAKAEAAT